MDFDKYKNKLEYPKYSEVYNYLLGIADLVRFAYEKGKESQDEN